MSDPVQDFSDEIEPELCAAFLDAIEAIRENVDVDSLIAAVERGDEDTVVGYVGDHLRPFRAILDAGFARSGTIAAGRLGLTFDPVEPTAIGARAAALTGFLRSIIADTAKAMMQAGFRSTLLPAVAAGMVLSTAPLPAGATTDKAILIREAIGLTPPQGASLAVFRAALERALARQSVTSPPIGFRRELPPIPELPPHVLRHLNVTQRRVIEKATTLTLDREKVEALVDHQRGTMLNVRANAIAATGATTITNAGENASWRQAVDRRDLGPEWRRYWIDRDDERVRHDHAQVKHLNATGVGIDEPFETPLGPCLHPPLEINCRCRVELRQAA
ncbi:phage minor head protein [Methylobacterium sp. 88A]|uniref:phage minor head protein n=1 Tax=Methylobacterium sp. 88A TaxID=1131813 RepID=UPI00036A1D6E|nr:phage minor head protein [Methylobacterium sp. 88A]